MDTLIHICFSYVIKMTSFPGYLTGFSALKEPLSQTPYKSPIIVMNMHEVSPEIQLLQGTVPHVAKSHEK